MANIALLFAGQGAQAPGMGRELCSVSPAAARLFQLAQQLRPGTMEQCFEGSPQQLSRTVNTQPCLFCVDLAAALALQEGGVSPQAVAGFSLGEVAALTFAGAFSQRQGFRFVCRRAQRMDEAAQRSPSAMAAVLGLQNHQVEQLCQAFLHLHPVNYNCPGQLVVAGRREALAALCAAVKQAGGRTVELPVSGGFHSPFMDSAAARLAEELPDYGLAAPALPVWSNRTAQPYPQNPEDCARLLAEQVNHPVLWEQTIRGLTAQGIDTFVEVGPGRTLSGFVRKIAPHCALHRVEDAKTLRETLSRLAG